MHLLSLLSLLPFAAAIMPPKSYCTPNAELIASITDSPDGKPFCSSLALTPLTVTAIVTTSLLYTSTVQANATVTEGVWSTHWSNATFTNFVEQNHTVTATVNASATALQTLPTTVIVVATKTLTTTATITTTKGRPGAAPARAQVITVHNPTAFPIPTGDVARLLGKRQEPGWPEFLSGTASTSITSACDCIVGYPETAAPATVNATAPATITQTETVYATSIATNHTSTTRYWNATATLNNTVTQFTTATITTTVLTEVTQYLNATTTTMAVVNATATAYPDCNKGYRNTGWVGSGNRVEIAAVQGNGTVACCEKCAVTKNCVANILYGFECQLLVNDVYTTGEVNRTLECALGHEDFPFVGEGPVFPGPCGY